MVTAVFFVPSKTSVPKVCRAEWSTTLLGSRARLRAIGEHLGDGRQMSAPGVAQQEAPLSPASHQPFQFFNHAITDRQVSLRQQK
jgi:hypothetical protein